MGAEGVVDARAGDRLDSGLCPASCSCLAPVAEWYSDYAQMIRHFLLARLRDRLAAEECTSETFLRVVAHRRAFRCTGDGLRPWLFTIARNVAHDYQRRAYRRNEIPVAYFVDGPDLTPTPEEAMVQRALVEAVHRRLDQLPEDQRNCVRLRFLHDCSVRQTAVLLGRNEGAVRALQCRAFRTLRARAA